MQIREVVPFRAGLPAVLPLLVFLSLDLGFFCFIWGCGVFVENLGFFDSGQIFVNVCGITVFSIQEYSSLSGVICAESVK